MSIEPYICPICVEEYCACEDDESDGPCPHGLDPDVCSFCIEEGA